MSTEWERFMAKSLPRLAVDDDSRDICDIIVNSFEQSFKVPMTVIVTKAGMLNNIKCALSGKCSNGNKWIRKECNKMGKDILIFAHSPSNHVDAAFDIDIYKSLFHGLILNQSDLCIVSAKLSAVFNHTFTVFRMSSSVKQNTAIGLSYENNYNHTINVNGNVYIGYQNPIGFDEGEYTSPWLLIAGTTESPSSIQAVAKTRDGNYLSGVKDDLYNMENMINGDDKYELHNTYRDMRYGKKVEALKQIGKLIEYALTPQTPIREYKNQNIAEPKDVKETRVCHIYYTGHGARNTGNWCFTDSDVSLLDIIKVVRSKINKMYHSLDVYLVNDCCFSGAWNESLKEIRRKICIPDQVRFFISSGCAPKQLAADTKNGGKFTNLILGRIGLNDFGGDQTPQPIHWTGKNENNDQTLWWNPAFYHQSLFV